MFNLNINWNKIINENLPKDDRVASVIAWLKVCISPFVSIYGEFMAKYQVFVYKVAFTFQVLYLETVLNNRFDPINVGIYIIDGGITQTNYLYQKSESKPPVYRYWKWKPLHPYLIGEFAIRNNKVWRCISPNTGCDPSLYPLQWVYHAEVKFRRRNSEFNLQYDFIVKVPASVTFDTIAMRALIDFYRWAGKRYKIEIY